ncbi:MAG: DNA-processing protein DprA [Ferruginibacter sp.]
MNADLLYQLALTMVPQIGAVHARSLLNIFGNAANIFQAKRKTLEGIEGIGSIRATAIKKFDQFQRCETELKFIDQYKITALCISDAAYPKRLLHCYDAPSVLYYKGNASLNAEKIIAIIGTRNNSEYGRHFCEKFIEELIPKDVLIVSGLALGIDTIAHKNALRNQFSTVGVLAHGLDRIYPFSNKALAKQMVEQGGLLTEFISETNPDKQNFPRRNRIVAGMCDALVVVETGKSGGSLITAELANGYNKDVFAVPGRTTDTKSEGCNYLIKNNKAALINDAQDFLELMNWAPAAAAKKQLQRQLFVEFTADEERILALLKTKPSVHIDDIYLQSNLSSSAVASALLTLEMQGIIHALPGKLYEAVG